MGRTELIFVKPLAAECIGFFGDVCRAAPLEKKKKKVFAGREAREN